MRPRVSPARGSRHDAPRTRVVERLLALAAAAELRAGLKPTGFNGRVEGHGALRSHSSLRNPLSLHPSFLGVLIGQRPIQTSFFITCKRQETLRSCRVLIGGYARVLKFPLTKGHRAVRLSTPLRRGSKYLLLEVRRRSITPTDIHRQLAVARGRSLPLTCADFFDPLAPSPASFPNHQLTPAPSPRAHHLAGAKTGADAGPPVL